MALQAGLKQIVICIDIQLLAHEHIQKTSHNRNILNLCKL